MNRHKMMIELRRNYHKSLNAIRRCPAPIKPIGIGSVLHEYILEPTNTFEEFIDRMDQYPDFESYSYYICSNTLYIIFIHRKHNIRISIEAKDGLRIAKDYLQLNCTTKTVTVTKTSLECSK